MIANPARLTRREREVAGCLVGGLTNKQIALYLSIEIDTVKYHVTSILNKLCSTNRTAAAVELYSFGYRAPVEIFVVRRDDA